MHLSRIRHTRKIIILIIIILVICILIIHGVSTTFFHMDWGPVENITCYYMESEDVLSPAEDVEFPAKSIFFHETSCKGGLDARQACAVESAARAHLNWQINVLFTAPGTDTSLNKSLVLINKLNNVKFLRIHVNEYSKNTPLEKFIADGALQNTKWRISHTSDVLRYLTLYKWGGVYLDLDTIVVKPFTSLARNWAARESQTAIAAGALAFSRDNLGRSIAAAALRDIKNNYRGDIWGHNGPGVITRVLKKWCSTSRIEKMTAATCEGFEVYKPQLFYPIEWQQSGLYFKPGNISIKDDVYVYHVWNRLTRDQIISKGCPYQKLAKRYCPIVYETFTDDFSIEN